MIIDFATVKKIWREYLDGGFDHKMVLNDSDPLVPLIQDGSKFTQWGVVTVPYDPTVENMAKTWGAWAAHRFGNHFDYYVRVWEASTNAATWRQDASTE